MVRHFMTKDKGKLIVILRSVNKRLSKHNQRASIFPQRLKRIHIFRVARIHDDFEITIQGAS